VKSEEVEFLSNEAASKAAESAYLRESLHRAQGRLGQEKRLNVAIKDSKTFHLENEHAHIKEALHTKKSKEEEDTKEKMKRQRELLKRKNYEIKTLKADLCDAEMQLYDRENRLQTLVM